uniref:Uncharacterized protein n=1 Tax=viral metagenome TaxID=1070528 RepID=A0A6C0I549_9ZZZZ
MSEMKRAAQGGEGIICVSVGELDFQKSQAPDGSRYHYYGDMVLAKETPLNKLLNKYGFLADGLKSYVGHFNHKIAIFNSNGERADPADVLAEDVENLVAGVRYKITASLKWCKEATFVRYESGPFYKWQTRSGFIFLLTQEEVDTLTEKEKRQLCIVR